ncbi:MAG: TadE/TadG family type IV pilus assembly protein [Sphingobium sp.]|nr:TadE/TadG family type IV pilus assembly protein [Sphingobium sp.]
MRPGTLLRRLRGDERGNTVVEFAAVATPLCILLLGGMDLGHSLYLQSVLQGAVQKAGRDSGLDNGGLVATQTTIDDKVKDSVAQLIPNATVNITRRYYKSFTEAAAAIREPFTDTNGNGTCDAGEPYQDNNNNSVWDADGGNGGQGSAKDNVVYTVNVTYPHLFPVTTLIGLSPNVSLTATTVLANQPYGDQSQYGAPVARNCT